MSTIHTNLENPNLDATYSSDVTSYSQILGIAKNALAGKVVKYPDMIFYLFATACLQIEDQFVKTSSQNDLKPIAEQRLSNYQEKLLERIVTSPVEKILTERNANLKDLISQAVDYSTAFAALFLNLVNDQTQSAYYRGGKCDRETRIKEFHNYDSYPSKGGDCIRFMHSAVLEYAPCLGGKETIDRVCKFDKEKYHFSTHYLTQLISAFNEADVPVNHPLVGLTLARLVLLSEKRYLHEKAIAYTNWMTNDFIKLDHKELTVNLMHPRTAASIMETFGRIEQAIIQINSKEDSLFENQQLRDNYPAALLLRTSLLSDFSEETQEEIAKIVRVESLKTILSGDPHEFQKHLLKVNLVLPNLISNLGTDNSLQILNDSFRTTWPFLAYNFSLIDYQTAKNLMTQVFIETGSDLAQIFEREVQVLEQKLETFLSSNTDENIKPVLVSVKSEIANLDQEMLRLINPQYARKKRSEIIQEHLAENQFSADDINRYADRDLKNDWEMRRMQARVNALGFCLAKQGVTFTENNGARTLFICGKGVKKDLDCVIVRITEINGEQKRSQLHYRNPFGLEKEFNANKWLETTDKNYRNSIPMEHRVFHANYTRENMNAAVDFFSSKINKSFVTEKGALFRILEVQTDSNSSKVKILQPESEGQRKRIIMMNPIPLAFRIQNGMILEKNDS
jgi:hypothetical protein